MEGQVVDVIQEQLDLFEQQILTDVFGGYTADKFVVRYGLFSYDFSDKIQKAIQDFEQFVRPFMDADGKVAPSVLNKYIHTEFIHIDDDARIKLTDMYAKLKPLVLNLKQYVFGLKG